MEKVVETRICKWTWKKFDIFEWEVEMLKKVSPKIGWEVFHLPIFDLSPKAREINRLIWRNERKFYKIEWKSWNLVSTIHPEMRKKIVSYEEFSTYNHEENWISYSWNIYLDFKKLLLSSQHANLVSVWLEDSSYCNQEAYDKWCYLNVWWHSNHDSMYNTFATESKDSVDNYWVFKSELVYGSINIFQSSKVFFSNQVKNSFNIYFGYDLVWCQNVIFWNWLENGSYIYKNKKLEKEEWLKIDDDFKKKLKTYDWFIELQKEYYKFLIETKANEIFIEWSEESYWNIITDSKNSFYTLYWEKNENIYNANIAWDIKNWIDINSFAEWSKLYNVVSSFKVNSTNSSWLIVESNDSYYCFWLDSTNFMFSCFWFWLKGKSYMILNKQYEKSKWEEKVKEIINELQKKWEWGRFLKPELSPYPYNDSVAMEYHPIKEAIYLNDEKIVKKEIIDKNWEWIIYVLEPNKFISKAILDLWWVEKVNIYWRTKETEIDIPEDMEKLEASELPNIDDVDYNILKKAIICEKSKRPFRIVKKELDFYKKYSLPLPRLHYEERHKERIMRKTTKMYYKK